MQQNQALYNRTLLEEYPRETPNDQVRLNAADPERGYLDQKLIVGDGVLATQTRSAEGVEQLVLTVDPVWLASQIEAGVLNDQVRLDEADLTTGYLQDKLLLGAGITATRTTSGEGVEQLTLTVDPVWLAAQLPADLNDQVKLNAADPTSDYLDAKIIVGDGITLTQVTGAGSVEQLVVAVDPVWLAAQLPADLNDQVKLNAADPTGSYLDEKLVVGDGITLTQVTGAGSLEQLVVAVDPVWLAAQLPADLNDQVKLAADDPVAGYLEDKLIAGSNITIERVTDGGVEKLSIAATGGSGDLLGVSVPYSDQITWNVNTRSYLQQTGNITKTFSIPSVEGRHVHLDIIDADASSTFSLPPNTTLQSGSFTNSSRNYVYYWIEFHTGLNGSIASKTQVVITTVPIPVDYPLLSITGFSLALDNTYVDVTYNTPVYATGGGAYSLSNASITAFTQNGDAVSSVSITSVTKTGGGALTGGETTIRHQLSAVGAPSTGLATFSITSTNIQNLDDEATASTSTATITFNNAAAPVPTFILTFQENDFSDSSGNNTQVTVNGTGAVFSSDSQQGNTSLDTRAVNSSFEVITDVPSDGDFTRVALIKFTGGSNGVIFASSNTTTSYQQTLYMINSTNFVRATGSDLNNNIQTAGFLNTWFMVAQTFNATTGETSIKINNNALVTGTVANTQVGGTVQLFGIGTALYFRGFVDEVRHYDTILTNTELNDLYNYYFP